MSKSASEVLIEELLEMETNSVKRTKLTMLRYHVLQMQKALERHKIDSDAIDLSRITTPDD